MRMVARYLNVLSDKLSRQLELAALRSRGLWPPLWNNSLWSKSPWLPYRNICLLRRLGIGVALGVILCSGVKATSLNGTYTSDPLNLALPNDDADDWGPYMRGNFTTLNSSFSSLAQSSGVIQAIVNQLAASTATLNATVSQLNTSTIALAATDTALTASSVALASSILQTIAIVNSNSSQTNNTLNLLAASTITIFATLPTYATTYIDTSGDSMTGKLNAPVGNFAMINSTYSATFSSVTFGSSGALMLNNTNFKAKDVSGANQNVFYKDTSNNTIFGDNAQIYINQGGSIQLTTPLGSNSNITASSITVGANGIRFSDGSNMTVAASGSAGSNNNWTGVNTFQSSVTVNAVAGVNGENCTASGCLFGVKDTNGETQFFVNSGTRSIVGTSAGGAAYGALTIEGAPLGLNVVNGDHLFYGGVTPSTGTGCGTTLTLIKGNDQWGYIVLGSGVAAPCIINWNKAAKTTYRRCTLTPCSNTAGGVPDFNVGTSSGQISQSGTTLTGGQCFQWNCGDFN